MATTRTPAETTTPLLEITDLVVDYRGRGRKVVRAVDGVSLQMEPGSVLALIGESGSGKTSLARAVCGLLPYAGTVRFEGQTLDRSTLKPGRVRPIQIVHQNPFSALNPRWPIWKSVAEPIVALNRQLKRSGDARAQARAALVRVGLAEHLHDRLPHRVSGGQCQRVAIARAVATETKLLVLDEAVSALDAAVKKDILKLLRDLAVEAQVSYLFVTHDMATVADIASHVAVMESGRLVETGTSRDVLLAPREDYTRQLISAVPTLPREGAA